MTSVETVSKNKCVCARDNMSGGNKAIELQLQMRQNAEDMLSFMKDLENWETDIKKKDEELRTGGVKEAQVSPWCRQPPINPAEILIPSVVCAHQVSAACCLCVICRRSSHLCAIKTTKQR